MTGQEKRSQIRLHMLLPRTKFLQARLETSRPMQPQCLQGDPTKGGNGNAVIQLLYKVVIETNCHPLRYISSRRNGRPKVLLSFKWRAVSESSLSEQGGAMIAHKNKAALKGSNNCALFNLQTRFDFPDIFLRKVSAELAWKFQVAELRKCFGSITLEKRKQMVPYRNAGTL